MCRRPSLPSGTSATRPVRRISSAAVVIVFAAHRHHVEPFVLAGMGLLDSIGAEILPLIAEGQVGGDDTGASLKALREQVERAARALKRYESRLVHN